MFRLSDNHPVLKGSRLWSISVASASFFVPWLLSQSLPPRSESVISSPQPSPQESPQPSLHPSPDPLSAEREWQHRLVRQSLSWQRPPTPPPTATPSESTVPKSEPTVPKTETPPSSSSVPKPPTPLPPKPTAQSQTSNPSVKKAQTSPKTKAQAPKPPADAPILEIRVAIARDVNSLTVGTSTPGTVVDANGQVLGKLSANEGTHVHPDGGNIRIGKWQTPAGVWLKPTNNGLVFVNGRWYRGDLLLVSQGNSLLAVNYVDIEEYLVSVVGSEVYPSWPMAALKAQAIAARSYALVHYIRPAHGLYDLGNTQRWQVYKGIEAEWNTTSQAVQETRGVFLSYKGGVVESMYAASDDIVRNVFGGRGMSQTGAYNLAMQGYDYQQILDNYYPGAGLAWIDTQESDTH